MAQDNGNSKPTSLIRKLLGSGMAGEAADKSTMRERRRQWQMRNPGKDPDEHKDEWQ